MPKNNMDNSIIFFADKIHVHRWPQDSPVWAKITQENVDLNLNKNIGKKKIMINIHKIKINEYEFDKIKKIGITVPLFKKQTTMIFEGRFGDSEAHVHITTNSHNYLEIFNRLMSWRDRYFSNSS